MQVCVKIEERFFSGIAANFASTFCPMNLISSFIPFPPISWCAYAIRASVITFDKAERGEKMSYRNRYRIGGANNENTLSIPLKGGRDSQAAMDRILIHNAERWQVQHWRTLESVYRRAPYWEHFEADLKPLFDREFLKLTDFNMASVNWVFNQLRIKAEIQFAEEFVKHYPAGTIDLRAMRPSAAPPENFPKYYQIFEDRIGFLPDLSILDLLFSEGPAAVSYLQHFPLPAI